MMFMHVTGSFIIARTHHWCRPNHFVVWSGLRTVIEEISTLSLSTSLTFFFLKVECIEIFVGSRPGLPLPVFSRYLQIRLSIIFLIVLNVSCVSACNTQTMKHDLELIDHMNMLSLSDFGTDNMSKLKLVQWRDERISYALLMVM